MRNKFLPFLMLMALFAPWAAQAQETLTVYDGTSQSSYVPAYMSYFDDFSRSQFVIPASNLEVMGGGTISSIKFYTTDYNVPYTSVSTVDVYLMEVNYTTMTALEPKANGTIVYQGKLNVVTEGSGGSLTINFSTPYNYGGGNLLIGIENTTDTGYKFIYFYGQTVSGASWAGYNTSSLSNVTGSQQNFIPKTTFTYEAASSCPRPTGLTVSNITTTGATFTWNGSSDSYVVMVKEAGQSESTNLTYDFEDGTSQGWTTLKGSNGTSPNNWMHISEYSYAYNYEAMSSGRGYNGSDGYMYSESYITGESQGAGTPVYPDNYLVSPQVRLGGSITFHAGGQNVSYCAEHFSLMVSTTGNDAINNFTTVQTWTFTPTASSGNEWQEFTVDLSAYSGMGYVAIHHFDCYDQWFLCIDDITIDTGEESPWTTYPASASPFSINNLTPGTTYDVKVIGICNGEVSEASNTISFTTDVDCEAAITSLPWSENFNGYTIDIVTSTSAPSTYPNHQLPNCWSFLNLSSNTGNYPQAFLSSYSSYAVSGNCLFFKSSSSTPLYAILPKFEETTSSLQLTFTYRNEGTTSSNGTLYVGYMTDPNDASIFTSVYTCAQTTTKTTETIYFPGVPANSRIAFKYQGGSNNNYYLSIDDVVVDMAPTCFAPTNLNVADIAAYTAMLSWTDHNEATNWQICLNGDEANLIDVTENPFMLSGLTPETTYNVKVRANCGAEDGMSAWSDMVNFTTTIACPAPTNLAVTDITGHGATLTWEGSSDSYVVSVGTYDYTATPTTGTLIEEGFERDGDIPTGWNHIGNGSISISSISTRVHTGAYSLRFEDATSNNVVVLPKFGEETNTMTISFWSLAENSSSSGSLEVGYVTDTTDASTFHSVTNEAYPASAHLSYTHVTNVSLASAPIGARIAFRHTSAVSNYWWWIDDITIDGPVYPIAWTEYTTEAETYTFTTLIPETYYEAKVQSNCGDDGMSAWSNTVNFTTDVACMPPTNLAATGIDAYSEMLTWEGNADSYNVRYITSVFHESFEEGLGDWTVYPGGDAGAIEWYVDDPSQSASLTAHSGNNVVWSFSDANVHASDWLVSPELDLGGTLKYWAMSEYQDAYEVKLSTTGIDTVDFTVTLRPLEASDMTWTEVSIDLSAYEGQRGRIAFHHNHTGGFFLMIDDIGIYGWSEPMSTDSTSFALYDLDPETEYSWQVQASCGGEDGNSRWVEGSFTTGVSCNPPTGLEVDESSITAHRATVTWDAEEGVTFQYSFPNTYHPNINPETLTFTDIQGNSKTLTNLRADTDYGFYLRKNCGEDGYSDIVFVVFHTPEACPTPSNFDVANIFSHAATLTWEGNGESYNVMYGAVNTLGSYKFDNEVIPSNFTNGDTPWKIWEENPNSGSYCIASDNYNEANTTATISLTATYEEDGTIEFYSRVSSESISYDYGTFFIDDVEKLREGGNSNTWMHYVYEVSAGEHTFIWNYRKDGGVNGGEDRYYIDDIILRTNSIEWITVNANDTICTLTGLTPETLYKAKVQSDCGSEGVSNESEVITFTTLENCPQPKDIEVSNVTRYTATVNWTGDSESFTVSYRMNGGYDIDFTEDFADETPVNYSATTYYLPEGWQSYNSNSTGYCPRVTNSSNYSYISTFGTGNNFLLLTTNDTGEYAYAIMPFYNNIADVQFNYAYENISNGTLTVGYVTNNTGYSTYTALQTMSATTISTHFTLSAADIATINNVNGYIAFRYQSGSSLFYSVGIDDIAILAGNLHNVSEWQSVVVTETTAYLTGLEASTKYDVKVIPSCDETNESDIVNFTTMDGNMKIFLTEGDWGDASNWMDEEMPTLADTAILRANATVTGVAEADQITFEGSSTLTIADGGQLKTNNDVLVTMKKNIAGYGTNNASTDYGYYLITAPTVSYWSAADYGLITADSLYDLYSWNRTATDEEWYNTKNNSSDFYMYNGMGYLYANENDVEMSFTYPVKNSTEPVVMTPEYDEVFKGWNLYGNPFPCDAYITTDAEGMTFYRLIGNELVPITGAIAPMEGFFVKATAAGQTFTISREAPRGR